jgi:hypothetical protein
MKEKKNHLKLGPTEHQKKQLLRQNKSPKEKEKAGSLMNHINNKNETDNL